ncbi:hypothetical protein COLO4_24436 [Corchorus olitorius]|uniref:non-specific serine/threonine protein kinase n=1 Tax=Corchorus olitorius TaxID=93759 RepID=A0A1R3IA89_9ROSI|nr:hypothetical protein COLO4_24436 [Corchorus olitorius]
MGLKGQFPLGIEKCRSLTGISYMKPAERTSIPRSQTSERRVMLMKSNQTDWSSSFYVDSEFWELSFVKEDVYRFGVLLLELITGYDPSKLAESSNTEDDQSLTKWVFDVSERADFYDIVDKSLVGRGYDFEIFQIFRVACDCVQLNADTRPTMLEVHKAMRTVGKRHDIKTSSEVTKSTASECSEAEIIEI